MENKKIMSRLVERIVKMGVEDRFEEVIIEDFNKHSTYTSDFKIVVPAQENENNIVTVYIEAIRNNTYKIEATRPFKDMNLGEEYYIENIENTEETNKVLNEIAKFLFMDNVIFINEKSGEVFVENLKNFLYEKESIDYISYEKRFYSPEDNKISIFIKYTLKNNECRNALISIKQSEDEIKLNANYKNNTRIETFKTNEELIVSLIHNDMIK